MRAEHGAEAVPAGHWGCSGDAGAQGALHLFQAESISKGERLCRAQHRLHPVGAEPPTPAPVFKAATWRHCRCFGALCLALTSLPTWGSSHRGNTETSLAGKKTAGEETNSKKVLALDVLSCWNDHQREAGVFLCLKSLNRETGCYSGNYTLPKHNVMKFSVG